MMDADEHERSFREAQRAADTIFSHYQLSQLLATHELPEPMAQAVLDELVHVCGAAGGAIWLARPPDGRPELLARSGTVPADTAAPDGAWLRVELEDVGTVALVEAEGRPIEPADRRFLDLVRHELAIALRGALLREALEGERSELAAVIHGASDAIVVVGHDRRVTRVNPSAARLVRRPASDLVGAACHEVLGCPHEGEPPRPCGGRCPFERVLDGAEPIDGAERTVRAGTGESTDVVGSYARISGPSDERPRAVAILRDTTELARLAELRRGFLGAVSHELRTPLALISGYVETLLAFEHDPETSRRYLERIDETTRRLGDLVAQIIDATQLAADHLELVRRPVALSELVEEVVRDTRVRHPEVEFSVDLADGLPPVLGDRPRLRQVLDNLVANAVKYGAAASASGPGVIEVSGRPDGERVAIRIEDRGLGVPDDERELVFEQFHRGRNVGDRPGSGLGLAVSRRLVEAHGGSIAFDPDRQVGSAVVVRLPAATPVVEGAQAEPAARSIGR